MTKKLKPIKSSLTNEIVDEVMSHLRDTMDTKQVGMTEEDLDWVMYALTMILSTQCYRHKDLAND